MKGFFSVLAGFILVCFCSIVEAQNFAPPQSLNAKDLASPQSDTTIAYLFSRLAKSQNDSSRIAVNDSIITAVESYVNSESVFRTNYRNARYLGQITSPDSMLKIVTWNLALENNNGRYYSYIIRKSNTGKKNKIYSLSTSYNQQPILSDTIYKRSDWYGSLYYDVRPAISSGDTCWVVLGLSLGDPLVSRKIIDVISFDDDDSIVLGKKWFLKTTLKHRMLFEYASIGTMTLRFTSDKSILFDHLVAIGPGPDNRTLFGADYSYDSFTFTNETWIFQQNVEARNKE
ncbi:MAG TPA: hypothetical protein VHO50_01765 [Bacteroidales bacterium]|nr:hypothetical protein [Bacteroidales bacterium]